jgi:hypothetical protein
MEAWKARLAACRGGRVGEEEGQTDTGWWRRLLHFGGGKNEKGLGFLCIYMGMANRLSGRIGLAQKPCRAACRATVPRWRPRPGPTHVPGWPVERRPACRSGLVSGSFGPFSCRPSGPGPSGQL